MERRSTDPSELEQDFIQPESVQALIWQELTPVLLTSAILPRWWDVSQNELHAVALYQRLGYCPLQAKPYPDLYHRVDEQGNVHEGVELIVDMQKWL